MRRVNSSIVSLLVFFLITSIEVQGENDSLITADLVKKLRAGDDTVIPELKKRRKKALELIKQPSGIKSKELSELLKKLDSEKFMERKNATKKLIDAGPSIFPAVKKHIKEHLRNPEVKIRCKQILNHPVNSTQKQVLIQEVKFLISLNDLEKETILQFKNGYSAYLEANKKEFQKWNSKHHDKAIRFATQFAKTKKGKEELTCWLKKIGGRLRPKIALEIIKNTPKNHFISLLKSEYLLGGLCKRMLEDRKSFNKKQWELLIKKITKSDISTYNIAKILKQYYLPEIFRKNAALFIQSRDDDMQQIGIRYYDGKWPDQKDALKKMMNHEDSFSSGIHELEDRIMIEKFSPADYCFFLELFAESTNHYIEYKIPAELLKKSGNSPSKSVMTHLRNNPIAFQWAKTIIETYPDKKAELKNIVLNQVKAQDKPLYFLERLEVLKNFFGMEFKTGGLDLKWLEFINNKDNWNCYYDDLAKAALILKITPGILFSTLIKIPEKEKRSSLASTQACYDYIFLTDNFEICRKAAELLRKNCDYSKKHDYDQIGYYRFIQKIYPEESEKILLAAADKLLPELHWKLSELPRYDSLGKPENMIAFIYENEDAAVKIMNNDKLKKQHLLFVYFFAMKKNLIEKYGKLLKKRLLELIPQIKDRKKLLSCAIIAGNAMEFEGNDWDKIILDFFRDLFGSYSSPSLILSLNKKQAHLIPELIKINRGLHAPYPNFFYSPMYAAFHIDPENKALLRYIKKVLLTSDSSVMACHAAKCLSQVDSMPALSEIPEDRIKWFLARHKKRGFWYRWSFITAFKKAAEQKKIAQLVKPHVPYFAEMKWGGSSFPRLFKSKEKNWLPVIEEFVRLLETGDKKTRSWIVRLNLRKFGPKSGLEKFADRIHTCLKKEQDKQIQQMLLEVVGRMGTDASTMLETVCDFSHDDDKVLFCMANISKDKAFRKKYLKKLIKKSSNYPLIHSSEIVSYVNGFDKIKKSFFKSYLDNLPEYRNGASINSEGNILKGFATLKPNEEIFQIYLNILKEAGEEPLRISSYTFCDLLDSLREKYPDRLPECEEAFKQIPYSLKLSSSYWKTMLTLKKQNILLKLKKE